MEQFMIEYAASWFQGWDKFALYQAEMLSTRITPLEAFLSMSTNENLLLTFPPPPTMTEFINIIKGVSTSANETSSFQQKFSGWDNYVKSCPHSYYVYQEYCKYLLTRRNYAQIRSLFKKIGNKRSKLDVSELNVIKDWFTFEENYCQDIKTLLFVSEKLLPLEIQSLIVEMSAGPIEKQAATCQTTADNQQKQEEQHSQSNPRKRKQENDAVDDKGSKKKKVIFSDADELCAESVMPVQPPANSLSTTKVQQDDSTPMEISNTSIQTSIIRFKNIPFTSKLPEISAFFSQFVPFQKLEMIYSKSGVFRGMVNIEYASIDHIRDLLSHSTQFTLLGRPLEYELNVPALNNFDPALFTTIFINHIPSETKESELMEFFISCGPIQRIHLAIDKKTSQLKVFPHFAHDYPIKLF
jgi:RNA recognition motif-containing protein